MTNTQNKLQKLFIGSLAFIALFAAAASTLFFVSPSAAEVDDTASLVEDAPQGDTRVRLNQFRRGRLGNHEAANQVVADALGITVEELEAARAEGTRLPELAESLGVDMADIYAAQQAAAEAAIAEAVVNGDLTQEEADAMLERLTIKALARQIIDKDVVQQAIADELGLTVAELESAKEEGTLRDLIEEQGLSREDLKNAKQAAVEEMVAQAVTDGTITQEQADQILAGKTCNKRGHRGGRGQEAPAPEPASLDA